MSKEKQISEIAEIILDVDRSYYGMECDEIQAKAEATAIYDKDFRKIYDDNQRQCTCYALGCQMAEELEKKVAKKFIEAVDSMMECVCAMTGLSLTYYGEYAELKKKYTESEDTE